MDPKCFSCLKRQSEIPNNIRNGICSLCDLIKNSRCPFMKVRGKNKGTKCDNLLSGDSYCKDHMKFVK